MIVAISKDDKTDKNKKLLFWSFCIEIFLITITLAFVPTLSNRKSHLKNF